MMQMMHYITSVEEKQIETLKTLLFNIKATMCKFLAFGAPSGSIKK